jgi:hypothetical protein
MHHVDQSWKEVMDEAVNPKKRTGHHISTFVSGGTKGLEMVQ